MKHLLVFTLLVLAAPFAESAAPPRVWVTFELEVPKYRQEFPAEALPAMAEQAATKIAEKLQGSVKFLSFESSDPAEFEIHLTLQVSPRQTSAALKQTVLRMELRHSGQRVSVHEHEFRPARDYDGRIAPAELFVREIALSVDRLDWGALQTKILSLIPIANSARSWATPPGWFLDSYRRTDLCLERGTILSVSSDVSMGDALQPVQFDGSLGDLNPSPQHKLARYRGHIFLSAEEVPAERRPYVRSNVDKLSIRAVYVRSPLPMIACTLSTNQ